eukprot:scaffold40580_cov46-Phaeocystis_antarctica.AAC.2
MRHATALDDSGSGSGGGAEGDAGSEGGGAGKGSATAPCAASRPPVRCPSAPSTAASETSTPGPLFIFNLNLGRAADRGQKVRSLQKPDACSTGRLVFTFGFSFVALGLTKDALLLVIHLDADLQVKVGPVSREGQVGPVSREGQVGPVSRDLRVAVIKQPESSNA